VVASTVVRRDRLRRWSLVAGVAAVLLVVPTVVAALPARVAPIEPARLAELIMRSADRPYQGYAESSGRLGVPELPNLSQVSSLLTGTTRIRSWYDSPTSWRFDVLSSLGGERDVYRTPNGEYIWDYGANLLTEVIGGQPVRLPRAGDVLPPDLARRVLSAAPGEPVSALPARREAGVSAAGLRVRPADPDTSVGQVDIWADPDSGLPVRVEVSARGASQPVLVSRFVELTQQRPAAETLVPNKPPDGGFTVTTAPDIVEALGATAPVSFPASLAGRAQRRGELSGLPGIGLYGTGLSAFVVLPLPRNIAGSATDAARKAGASDLTLPGGTGVLLSVAPVSVVIERSTVARRSYLLAGLVIPSVLERAAAELSTVPRSGA
jgi:hypothetical protein